MAEAHSRTVEIMNGLIEERRFLALDNLACAAGHLQLAIERLRWAPNEMPDLDAAMSAFRESAFAGLDAYGEMTGIKHDLVAVQAATAPARPELVPADRATKLNSLGGALVAVAERARADLAAFTSELTNGTGDDDAGSRILGLMVMIDDDHSRLRTLFQEAAEVAGTAGSA